MKRETDSHAGREREGEIEAERKRERESALYSISCCPYFLSSCDWRASVHPGLGR